MRIHSIRLAVVAVAAILAVAVAIAPQTASAVGPEGNWASGIACVNLGTTNGTATLVFYDQTGAVEATVPKPDAFEPNKPWLLFTPNIPGLGDDFFGSAVFSSDVQANCSVNTQTAPGQLVRVGTSGGVSGDDTGPTLYATQILNALAGFNSYVAVQNASSSEADVVAEYYDSNGALVKTLPAVKIPPNASHTFYQDDGNLPANFIGSAIFKSQDTAEVLAGSVGLYNTNTAQLLSVNTFKDGAAKVFVPRLAKNLSGVGYTSGFACQNLGPGDANMTMEISFFNQANQQTVTQTLTKNGVKQGQSWLGYVGDITGAIGGITRGFGSATVTSTGGLIACTLNEDVRTSPTAALVGQGSTYAGVPDGDQSTKMSFSQIVALGEASYRGGMQYANTTATATTCTHTYSNGDVKSNVPLAANGSNSIFAQDDLTNNKTNFNGSVEVECGQPIVGIYNLSIIGGAASGDPFATNNGTNKQ